VKNATKKRLAAGAQIHPLQVDQVATNPQTEKHKPEEKQRHIERLRVHVGWRRRIRLSRCQQERQKSRGYHADQDVGSGPKCFQPSQALLVELTEAAPSPVAVAQ